MCHTSTHTNTHGTHTRHEHGTLAKIAHKSSSIYRQQHTTRNKGHTNAKKINHVICSGGNFGNVAYIIRLQIPYNNTLQKLYKGSIIICYYIMYARIAAANKDIRFIYCTLCQFCA